MAFGVRWMGMTSACQTARPEAPVLACAVDARYALPLAVMLRSVEAHVGHAGPLDVYVVGGGLSARARRRVAASLRSGQLRLHWLPPPPAAALRGLPVFGHVGVAAYFRIFLPDLLPPEITRAVYLDADLIAVGDLGPLWAADPGSWPLLAVQQRDVCLGSPDGLPRWREWGLPAEAKYLNSGVLVFNLECWRREGLSARIVRFLREHRADIRFWDQDGINAVLAGRWGELDPRWNVQVDCFYPPAGVTAAEWRGQTLRGAGIVHFASATKPWHYYVEHPAREVFFEYVDQTAWAGWRPRPPWRVLLNRHTWGRWLRQTPVLGRLWTALRPPRRER